MESWKGGREGGREGGRGRTFSFERPCRAGRGRYVPARPGMGGLEVGN